MWTRNRMVVLTPENDTVYNQLRTNWFRDMYAMTSAQPHGVSNGLKKSSSVKSFGSNATNKISAERTIILS